MPEERPPIPRGLLHLLTILFIPALLMAALYFHSVWASVLILGILVMVLLYLKRHYR